MRRHVEIKNERNLLNKILKNLFISKFLLPLYYKTEKITDNKITKFYPMTHKIRTLRELITSLFRFVFTLIHRIRKPALILIFIFTCLYTQETNLPESDRMAYRVGRFFIVRTEKGHTVVDSTEYATPYCKRGIEAINLYIAHETN